MQRYLILIAYEPTDWSSITDEVRPAITIT